MLNKLGGVKSPTTTKENKMYLQLTTDFIKVRKKLKLKDGRSICSNKRIWKLLWRGYSPENVYNIVMEEFMYWDNARYWKEKESRKSGLYYPSKYSFYGSRSNRYKDYTSKFINLDSYLP